LTLEFIQLQQSITETEHSQEITLHLYVQYSGSIALSTVCLVLLSNHAHGTDTGVEHSNSQICFHARSTLFSSSVKSP